MPNISVLERMGCQLLLRSADDKVLRISEESARILYDSISPLCIKAGSSPWDLIDSPIDVQKPEGNEPFDCAQIMYDKGIIAKSIDGDDWSIAKSWMDEYLHALAARFEITGTSAPIKSISSDEGAVRLSSDISSIHITRQRCQKLRMYFAVNAEFSPVDGNTLLYFPPLYEQSVAVVIRQLGKYVFRNYAGEIIEVSDLLLGKLLSTFPDQPGALRQIIFSQPGN